jgi:hypothetical protein
MGNKLSCLHVGRRYQNVNDLVVWTEGAPLFLGLPIQQDIWLFACKENEKKKKEIHELGS